MIENEGDKITELELQVQNLQQECEDWQLTVAQLNQTINKLVSTFIVNQS